jgi:Cd(II)/Pb(II)-responsive transcriptional regulator
MLIGELAKHTGCDPDTIRYYEREGLLATPARTASGYRRYARAHLEQLHFVRHCRSLGMRLMEIKALHSFQASPERVCAGINALLEKQIARIHAQVEALGVLEKQLRALRTRCDNHRLVRQCGILQNLANAAKDGRYACHTIGNA